MRVVRPPDLPMHGQRIPKQPLGLLLLARLLAQRAAEVIKGTGHLQMLLAQCALLRFQGPAVERLCSGIVAFVAKQAGHIIHAH